MRVLLLEDEPGLSDAVATHLQGHGFSVDAVTSIAHARSALAVGGFDIAIFDLSLPDGDGVGLLRSLRQQANPIPVVIMTARDQISDRIRGLDAGADDYLVKPFDLNEMLARLQAVLRRYGGNPAPVLQFGELAIDRVAHRVRMRGDDVRLTAKEWAVLDRLLTRPDSVVRKEQIEEALYSFNDEIESNTLEVYISRLRKKLGRDRIETVRGLGYRFVAGQA